MTIGPGKYDQVCTLVREQTEAEVCCVIVKGGNQGDGFSFQIDVRRGVDPIAIMAAIPSVLRDLAAKIEKDLN